MKTSGRMVYRASLAMALLGLALNLHAASGLPAGKPYRTDRDKSEAELIQDLAPTNSDRVIVDALEQLERLHDSDTNVTGSIPAMVNLLTDDRSSVRRKAARILGVIHAPLSEAQIRLVCRQLHAATPAEIQSGLKALRDLQATSTVPDVLPLLQDTHPGIVRDACRTLAVLADKSVVPDLQPLLNDPYKGVVKDANDAIFALNAK